MIVLTIVHGDAYIDRYFRFSLPSLLTPNNLPAITQEKLSLCIVTIEEDLPKIQKRLSYMDVSDVFGTNIKVLTDNRPPPSDWPRIGRNRFQTNTLLVKGVRECLEQDERFFFAVPDTVYGDGMVKTCYELHRLTGKVVAPFNGRVAPRNAHESFSTDELLNAAYERWGAHDFFFAHMNRLWRKALTTDAARIEGYTPGHLIYDANGMRFVFCCNPSPSLGKFTADDVAVIKAPMRGMRTWDSAWLNHLIAQQRFIVQTNLELGLSIEIEDASDQLAPDELDGMDDEQRRRQMFSSRLSEFCFTTTRVAGVPIATP